MRDLLIVIGDVTITTFFFVLGWVCLFRAKQVQALFLFSRSENPKRPGYCPLPWMSEGPAYRVSLRALGAVLILFGLVGVVTVYTSIYSAIHNGFGGAP